LYFLGKNISVNNSIGFTISLRNLQSEASEIATWKLQFRAAARVTVYFSPWSCHGAWTYHLYYLGISSRNYGRDNVKYSVQRHSVACVWLVMCSVWWSYECDILYIESPYDGYIYCCILLYTAIYCYWLSLLECYVSVSLFFADGRHTQYISGDHTRKCLVEWGLVIWEVSPPV